MSSRGKPAAAEDFDEASELAVPRSRVTASIKRKDRRSEQEEARKSRSSTIAAVRSTSDSGYDSVQNADSISTKLRTSKPTITMGTREKEKEKSSATKVQSIGVRRQKPSGPTPKRSSSTRPSSAKNYVERVVTENTTEPIIRVPPLDTLGPKRTRFSVHDRSKVPPAHTDRHHRPAQSNHTVTSLPIMNHLQAFVQKHHITYPESRLEYQSMIPQPPLPLKKITDRFGQPTPTGLKSPPIYDNMPLSDGRNSTTHTRFNPEPQYLPHSNVSRDLPIRVLQDTSRSRSRKPSILRHESNRAYTADEYGESCSCSDSCLSPGDYECYQVPLPPLKHLPRQQQRRPHTAGYEIHDVTKASKTDRTQYHYAAAEAHMADNSEVSLPIQREEMEELRIIKGLLLDNAMHNATHTGTSKSSREDGRSIASKTTTNSRGKRDGIENITIKFEVDSKMIINGDELVVPRGATMILPKRSSDSKSQVTGSRYEIGTSKRNGQDTMSSIDYLRHPLATQPGRQEYTEAETVTYVSPQAVSDYIVQRPRVHRERHALSDPHYPVRPEGIKRKVCTEYEYFADLSTHPAPPHVFDAGCDSHYARHGY